MPAARILPDHSEVLAQVDRICASRHFSGSERIRRFLKRIVDLVLAGRQDEIKEYMLAVEVFDRPDTYDPQVDSIVRVEASRLRGKLRDYYADEGKQDGLLIQIPRGSYVPQFVRAETRTESVVSPEREPAPAPPVLPMLPVPPVVLPVGTAEAAKTERRSRRMWLGLVVAAAVLLASLGAWLYAARQPRPSPPGAPAIAVLPFVNLGDAADERISDGLTEEITTSLAQLPGLRVPSRTTMSQYKGKPVDVAKLGEQLRVTWVLEGSVRRDGDQFRITAQLIDTADGYHLWAETYMRPVQQASALQGEVARVVVGELADRTAGRLAWRTSARPVAGNQAFAAYFEAYELLRTDFRLQRNEGKIPAGLLKSISRFEEATRLDPQFAKAWAGLATAYEFAIDFEPQGQSAMRDKAEKAVARALELDPTLAEAHALLGSIRLYRDWDWDGAGQSLRRSIELNPRDAHTQREYSDLLSIKGRHEESLMEMTRALTLQPDSSRLLRQKAQLLYNAGRAAEAQGYAEKAVAQQPDSREAQWMVGLCLQAQGKYAEAEAKYRNILNNAPKDGRALPALGHLLGQQGRMAEAQQVANAIEELTHSGRAMEVPLAIVYVGMGQKDKGIEWLQKAYAKRDPSLVYMKVSPRLSSLRGDSRFQELLRKMKLT